MLILLYAHSKREHWLHQIEGASHDKNGCAMRIATLQRKGILCYVTDGVLARRNSTLCERWCFREKDDYSVRKIKLHLLSHEYLNSEQCTAKGTPIADHKQFVRDAMPCTWLSQSELFTGNSTGLSLDTDLKKEILEKLDSQLDNRGHFCNLIVAATGTGKTIDTAIDFERFYDWNSFAKSSQFMDIINEKL
mgnify:CR=1